MLSDEQARELLSLYRQGRCSPEDKEAIENWYDQLLDKSKWDFEPGEEAVIGAGIKSRMDARLGLNRKLAVRPAIDRRRFAIAVAAAIALLLLTTTGYLLFIQHGTPDKKIVQRTKNDVLPGGNKAVLTLVNGTRIILDSAKNGQLALQGNSKIVKMDSGLLIYKAGHKARNEIAFNTLTTPKGGQYKMVLSDGTSVWLNALSSIRYPTVFTGTERVVEVTGEVYFEVAHNAKRPFKVKAGNEIIEVLGTDFNVSAYPDESIRKITLLEGSIKVSRRFPASGRIGDQVILEPGQQARVNRHNKIKLVKNIDTKKEIAWKNGLFYFRETSIPMLMKQLSRWYNINIEYADTYHTNYHFTGEISRNVPISKVLKMVERTGVAKFDINGKTVTILPGVSFPAP